MVGEYNKDDNKGKLYMKDTNFLPSIRLVLNRNKEILDKIS